MPCRPAIYAYGEFAEAGGLMSYGTDNFDAHRTRIGERKVDYDGTGGVLLARSRSL